VYQTVQHCNNCGANLTLDDMRRSDCPYCGTVYPHHSQAAQHAAMANQLMGQMMAQQAQIQNQWRAGFGAPPMPPAPGAPGSPYADPQRIAQAHMAYAQQMSRRVNTIVMISVLGTFAIIAIVLVLIFAL
jgi:predicted RNA-binding Zn-ribbon protein involved in translation (DUF1610 family)